MSKPREYIITTAIAVLFALLALYLTRNTFTPSAAQIPALLDAFRIEDSDLKGLYGNWDTDARVFRYTTSLPESEFWRRIEEAAAKEGWRRLPDSSASRRFDRMEPPSVGGSLFSAEEVRVRLDPHSRRVTVGWCQADSRQRLDSFAEAPEAKFAESEVWPKLDGK